MAKRPTPIERAIAGEPTDRLQRYLRRLDKRGMKRTTVVIPAQRHDELVSLCARWRDEFENGDD